MYIVKLIKSFNLNIKYMYIIHIFLNDFLNIDYIKRIFFYIIICYINYDLY